jgi:hypothetical protein
LAFAEGLGNGLGLETVEKLLEKLLKNCCKTLKIMKRLLDY